MKYLLLVLTLCISTLSYAFTDSVKILYKGHIYIEAIVNDSIDGYFMFDTGSPITVLFFGNTGKKAKGRFADVNKNRIKVYQMDKVLIRIGETNFSLDKTYSMPPMPYHSCLPNEKKLLGILGMDLIHQKAWQIDYKKKLIYIADSIIGFPQVFSKKESGYLYWRKKPLSSLDINTYLYEDPDDYRKNSYLRFVIDTGSPYDLIVKSSKIKLVNKHLVDQSVTKLLSLGMIGATGTVNDGEQIQFIRGKITKSHEGNEAFNNGHWSEVILVDKIGISEDGILGNKRLENYIFTFSHADRAYYLTPNNQKTKLPTMLQSITLYSDGARVIVSSVLSGKYKNLSPGDEVTKINGQPAMEVWCEYQSGKWEEFTIECLKDGQVFQVESFILD